MIFCVPLLRGALVPEGAALIRWITSSPLLIMGSYGWNKPNAAGEIKADGIRQSAVLAAAQIQ